MSALHSPTLRGFNHIALDTVLKRYFDIASVSEFNEQTERSMLTGTETAPTTDDGPSNAVERLWCAWTAIYRLVPATACLGEPL